jgi:hypothetical protein
MTAPTPSSVALPAGAAAPSVLPPRIILAIIGLAVGAVLAAVALFRATGRDWWALLRDPAAAFAFAPTAGLFSHLGVLAMAAMGAICIFASALMAKGARDRGVLIYVGRWRCGWRWMISSCCTRRFCRAFLASRSL